MLWLGDNLYLQRPDFMDPAAILQLADEPDLLQLGKEVRARLERVRDSLH